jgi:hypothetical protein
MVLFRLLLLLPPRHLAETALESSQPRFISVCAVTYVLGLFVQVAADDLDAM